jgi:hypothetical protein
LSKEADTRPKFAKEPSKPTHGRQNQFSKLTEKKLRVMIKRIIRKYKYPADDLTTGDYNVSITKVPDPAELLADFRTKE